MGKHYNYKYYIRKYGGCGILPSGTYHMDLPTTVKDRRYNATDLFGTLIQEYEQASLAVEV